MKLVTVLTTFNAAEADVAYSRLDASGFHPVNTNQTAALSIEGYAQAAGSILIFVQVPEDEAEDARELLAASGTPPS
jgi:hypothetical protein